MKHASSIPTDANILFYFSVLVKRCVKCDELTRKMINESVKRKIFIIIEFEYGTNILNIMKHIAFFILFKIKYILPYKILWL